jgi:hypothetical protein
MANRATESEEDGRVELDADGFDIGVRDFETLGIADAQADALGGRGLRVRRRAGR